MAAGSRLERYISCMLKIERLPLQAAGTTQMSYLEKVIPGANHLVLQLQLFPARLSFHFLYFYFLYHKMAVLLNDFAVCERR